MGLTARAAFFDRQDFMAGIWPYAYFKTVTKVWEGTMQVEDPLGVVPMALQPPVLVRRIQGAPPTMTEVLPVNQQLGPLMRWETTPVAVPASSPKEEARLAFWLMAGVPPMSVVMAAEGHMDDMAVLG